MSSVYPGALDTLATNKANATAQTTDHPAHHNDLADAVNKVEAELGVNPSGSEATVAARILSAENARARVGYKGVRDEVFAAVMGTAPTIAVSAQDAATSIASGVDYAETSPVFRWSGANVQTLAGYPYWKGVPGVVTDGGWQDSDGFNLEFETDADLVEFRCVGKGGFMRVWVDGQPATSGVTTMPTANGGYYRVLVTFASAALRRIRFEFSYTQQIGPFRVGVTRTVFPTTTEAGPRMIVIGDSITEGTGATTTVQGFVKTAGALLGIRDSWASGSGGTGYLNNGPDSRAKIRTRVAEAMTAFSPDIAVVAGGINDTDTTNATVYPAGTGTAMTVLRTEADTLLAQIRAALPNALLVVQGPFWKNGSPPNTDAAKVTGVRDVLEAAAAAVAGTVFVDNIEDLWITGTGKVGTTVGDGNADFYISSDGTHPSPAGHNYLARRWAASLAPTVPPPA